MLSHDAADEQILFRFFFIFIFFNFAAHDWLENKESLNIKKKLKFVRVPNSKE